MRIAVDFEFVKFVVWVSAVIKFTAVIYWRRAFVSRLVADCINELHDTGVRVRGLVRKILEKLE